MYRVIDHKTWYDYKMMVISELMKHDMQLISDKKGIRIYAEGFTRELAIYKRAITWKIFYFDVLPKILGKQA